MNLSDLMARPMDYLKFFPEELHRGIHRESRAKQDWIGQDKKGFLRYRIPLESIRHLHADRTDFTGDVVRIGSPDEISDNDRSLLQSVLKGFMPWRKGPFSVFGIEVDAEWQSYRKWNRIIPELPDLRNKIIADVGCNNGYYMFRMAAHQPKLVLGFDPLVHHYFTFKTLNSLAGLPNLAMDLLGVEHLNLFPECFDVIFLLGIIYHRPSPIDCLRDILTALKPGGTLVLESQAIPGDGHIALFPDQTYAKVPGTWFVPTGNCLHNWLSRCGFENISLFCSHPMSSDEQRRTEWMTFESYEDFIDKNQPDRTIEGYPAPWRVFLKATKKV